MREGRTVSAEKMVGWIRTIISFGNRRPGYPADLATEDFLESSFRDFGLAGRSTLAARRIRRETLINPSAPLLKPRRREDAEKTDSEIPATRGKQLVGEIVPNPRTGRSAR
jgi:hypothetical protein